MFDLFSELESILKTEWAWFISNRFRIFCKPYGKLVIGRIYHITRMVTINRPGLCIFERLYHREVCVSGGFTPRNSTSEIHPPFFNLLKIDAIWPTSFSIWSLSFFCEAVKHSFIWQNLTHLCGSIKMIHHNGPCSFLGFCYQYILIFLEIFQFMCMVFCYHSFPFQMLSLLFVAILYKRQFYVANSTNSDLKFASGDFQLELPIQVLCFTTRKTKRWS